MGRYAAQHPVLEHLNQKLEARSDTLRRRIAVYVEKRIQRAYPEAARRGVDEPFQSGVGAFQRGVEAGAGHGYRAAAAESG